MFDKLRRYVAFLVFGLLGWMVWGALNPEAGEKKAEAKVVRLEIDPKVLAVRPKDQAAVPISDVFRIAPQGGKSSRSEASGNARTTTLAAADPNDAAAAWVGSLRVLGRDFARAVSTWGEPKAAATASSAAGASASGTSASGQGVPTASPVSRPFEMDLQSTLALPDGGQARISGRTASVGESLDWLDPVDPPTLTEVSGTTATVVRGQDCWVLDLQGHAHVSVGGALAALAPTEGEARAAAAADHPRAAGAMGNPRVTRPPRARPSAGGASAGAASGAQAAPAAKSAKPASKGGYRVRSYPGKPK